MDKNHLEKNIAEYKQKIASVQNPSDHKDWELHNKLQPMASLFSQLEAINSKIDQAQELLESETSPTPGTPPESKKSEENSDGLKELAEADLSALQQQKETVMVEIQKEIEELEAPPTMDNINSIILEIRAGAGGEEASLFASNLFRMYSQYAQKNSFTVTILNKQFSDAGGFKEVVAKIAGDGVYNLMQYESGVHRVQRIPTTESSGRIHTSTASVVIMPEAKEIDIEIKPEEIKVDTFRASGAGGQHVNKTDSATRITHISTGIVVSCQESRSQIKNRETAMSLLRTKLLNHQMEQQHEQRDTIRREQIGAGMRSEKIRTYNYPQSRITDHRIKKSWHNLDKVLDGELDEIISQLQEQLKPNQQTTP